MPFTQRLIVALVLATATAAFAAPTGTAQQAAGSAQCANRETPPPPVDTSEQPAPGQKAPTPLEVPEKPVGGDRLGECGLILPPNSAQPPSGITAASWLLADMDSGAVIAAYDPHGRQRPASVIKVLLAMVVAKELRGDLVVTASAEDTQQECTCVGLKDGGQYTVRQLLQGLLLTSGNDVAHTLARQLGGLIDERVKVFDAMLPLHKTEVVRGQFDGYRDLDGVLPDSDTETFIAARVWIDNWRWAGVPFYLRTGKRMAQSRQTITLAFRSPPRSIFGGSIAAGERNHLTFELGSRESVSLHFLAKAPGPSIELGPARMDFCYGSSFGSELVEAYERLLHDALIGDRTLFTRPDGIARTWDLVADILEDPPPVVGYGQGTWGPGTMHELIAPRRWFLPELEVAPSPAKQRIDDADAA